MSYSSQVTSHFPIQKGAIVILCCGDSSSPRPSSLSGLPMTNSPPGIGTMSNETSVPTRVSVYVFISPGAFASAAGLATAGGTFTAGTSADSTRVPELYRQSPSTRKLAEPKTAACANRPAQPKLLIDKVLRLETRRW